MTLELVARLLGRDHDRTGCGIPAVQGTLRPLEHFDLLQIEQIAIERFGARQRDAIDDDRHIGIGVADGGLPPDIDIRFTGVVFDECDVRRIRQEVGRPRDAGGCNRVFGEDTDRDRYLGQAFVTFGCRNDNLFNLVCGPGGYGICLLYTSPSPRDRQKSRMPSSA